MSRRGEKVEVSALDASFDGGLLCEVSRLVPVSMRAEWMREWQAELWYLHHDRNAVSRLCCRREARLFLMLSLLRGMVADATWLRWDWLKARVQGSAAWCLTGLFGACVFFTVVELVLVGSWQALGHVIGAELMGSYPFVAIPATFAALVTYPPRELKWERKSCLPDASFGVRVLTIGWLSARSRWKFFLASKIVLTLTLGFLTTAVVSIPGQVIFGNRVDWFEMISSMVIVTLGLRWALLNQERRCQKCLRPLCQPMRVGPPSRNFLDWSGMEMACAHGHGRLQSPEMVGSWCWYDQWV